MKSIARFFILLLITPITVAIYGQVNVQVSGTVKGHYYMNPLENAKVYAFNSHPNCWTAHLPMTRVTTR